MCYFSSCIDNSMLYICLRIWPQGYAPLARTDSELSGYQQFHTRTVDPRYSTELNVNRCLEYSVLTSHANASRYLLEKTVDVPWKMIKNILKTQICLTLSYYNLNLFYILGSIQSRLVIVVTPIRAFPHKTLHKHPIFFHHLPTNRFSRVCLLPPITATA